MIATDCYGTSPCMQKLRAHCTTMVRTQTRNTSTILLHGACAGTCLLGHCLAMLWANPSQYFLYSLVQDLFLLHRHVTNLLPFHQGKVNTLDCIQVAHFKETILCTMIPDSFQVSVNNCIHYHMLRTVLLLCNYYKQGCTQASILSHVCVTIYEVWIGE
jgi:hypothetical protein